MKYKSHLTAIARKDWPTPVRWLMMNGYIHSVAVLDFGCGKCASVNPEQWDNYDPHYAPKGIPKGKKYDIILCTYVLCVLPPEKRMAVLNKIQRLLKPDWNGYRSYAYIAVRNDKPKQGWGKSSRGTYQGRGRNLNLPLVYKNSRFRIYQLTKKTKLVQ